MRRTFTIATCLITVVLSTLLTGCLTRRTVTSGGKTVESKYVFTNPF